MHGRNADRPTPLKKAQIGKPQSFQLITPNTVHWSRFCEALGKLIAGVRVLMTTALTVRSASGVSHHPFTSQSPQEIPHAFGMEYEYRTLDEVAQKLSNAAARKKRTRVAFVNAHCINEMRRSPKYDNAVRDADIVLPDGSGMAIATKLQSGRACANLNGTDLAPVLMRAARDKGLSVFLLGARPGVADTAAKHLKQTIPGLKIAGVHHGYFRPDEVDDVVRLVNIAKPDILLVAFGVPMQDVWLAKNAHKIDAPITLGVGGLLDFISGRIPRAPKLLRRLGLEWTYRLYQEPARMWRRYILGNPLFVWHTVADVAAKKASKLQRLADNAARRMVDVVGALTGLALLSPILAVTALTIRLESRGPAIFKQTRVGKNGAPFTLYKFRSMSANAEKERGRIAKNNHHGKDAVTFKIANDPRITRFGKIIRKYSIDELPQLWNVLRGDMSLVGPRPALPNEVAKYSDHDRKRLAVKPGITCIWQISGRANIDFKGQVALDLKYIRQRSIFQDLSILLRTPIAVLTARGAY